MIRINPNKTVFERIAQKNRLFFALTSRRLSLATQHRIVRVVFPSEAA